MNVARSGRVVLAPDKFKGSLSGSAVATCLAHGMREVFPEADIVVAPVADGGEGTVDAALAHGFDAIEAAARGPLRTTVRATLAVRGDTAIVELAQASGLPLLTPGSYRALAATTYGTGELISAALDAGCTRVILGLGGSASTDGGAGMLQALGATLRDADGFVLAPGVGSALATYVVDLTTLDPRLSATSFVIATDVDNVLLGAAGAARVFAPQKGATPDEVDQLEAALERWQRLVHAAVGSDHSTRPGSGAAGGTGFAALAALGATVRPGVEVLLEITGFDDLLRGAALVVTGEGSLDTQSLGGKTPIGVARAASRSGVPTVAVAGRTTLDRAQLDEAGFASTYTLQDLEPDLDTCMREAPRLLQEIGSLIALHHLDMPTRATSGRVIKRGEERVTLISP
jgi:glycerate kinase